MSAERLLPTILAALALVLPALSAEQPAEEKPPVPREAEASLELLEFLGSWETATGSWDESVPDREPEQTPRRPKEKPQ